MQSLPRRLLLQPARDFGENLPGDGISRRFTAIDHPHHFRDDMLDHCRLVARQGGFPGAGHSLAFVDRRNAPMASSRLAQLAGRLIFGQQKERLQNQACD
jgi:hypothetical protein